MALRGKKPKEQTHRLKLLMYGPAGIGKTMASIQMPRPYIIDTERGTDHYGEIIESKGGAVFQTSAFDEMVREVRSLMSEKHDFQTLVIDPFSTIYTDKVDEGERIKGDEWGRHYGYANAFAKRWYNLITNLDMNVVVTAHGKNEYGDGAKVIGQTFDGWKKLDYLFDLVVELKRKGKKRIAVVRKTRLSEFPDESEFEWSYENLAERYYAKEMEREATPFSFASPEKLGRLKDLIGQAGINDETVAKWLKKAGADAIDDLPSDTVDKLIVWCEAKATNDKPEL